MFWVGRRRSVQFLLRAGRGNIPWGHNFVLLVFRTGPKILRGN